VRERRPGPERELVAAFERVFGREVPVREAPPRLGDAVGAYANVDRIAELTGWRAEHDIDEGIASALAWGARRQEVLGYE
jgi:UDP-glucose 4-epimerase